MDTENTTLFEFARTIWLTENAQSLPSDVTERKALWHQVKQDYIGKAKTIVLQLEKRGIRLERQTA